MDARVEYSLSVLLGLESPADVSIVYGNDHVRSGEEPLVHILPSGFFGDVYGTAASLPRLPLKDFDGVPILFGKPTIVRQGSRLIVHADLIASAYFLLTRYEEWIRRDVRDSHGRFPGIESLPYQAGFIDRPIVDEYGLLLRQWAADVGIHLPAPRRRFSVLLTHDVDYVGVKRGATQPLRSLARGLLGREPWQFALRAAASAASLAPDPLDNFDELIRLDGRLLKQRGSDACRSIYFFMASPEKPGWCSYSVQNRQARDVLHRVLKSGAEVGLHSSYEVGRQPELVAMERATLEAASGVSVEMNRHHYLAWREPEDGHALAAAGITWDSTLGYADVAGFRLGVCHSVPLFDPIRRQPLGIEEHPLIVMECSLSDPPYMSLDEEAAFDYVCRLADATLRHQGEFVVLWHNHTLVPLVGGYHRCLYPRVLDYLDQLLRTD